MTSDEQRKAFEKWATSQQFCLERFNAVDEYINDNTHIAWEAWQAAQAVDLNEIEQYRIQMEAISTASFGYWKEKDSILPEYDTVPLRDVAKLYQKYDALYKAKLTPSGWLRAIDEALVMHDVGVANADDDYATAKDKLNKLLCVVQDIGAYFAKQESAQAAAEPVSKEWDSLSSIGNRLHNISVELMYICLALNGKPLTLFALTRNADMPQMVMATMSLT